MFELWAKKRPVDGRGFPYEWICNFENEQAKYYIIDQLDRDKYMEAMVLEGNRLLLYREFEKPYTRRLR